MHVSTITSNERCREAMRCWLEETEYTIDMHSAEANETEQLAATDAIVLDAHAVHPKQACRAVRRVRAAREQDIGTPFVILAWLPRRDIVNAQLASNPFIGHFYKDSCCFLRLPVRPERLIESLREVRPCTKEEIATGKRHLAGIDHAHRTSAQ